MCSLKIWQISKRNYIHKFWSEEKPTKVLAALFPPSNCPDTSSVLFRNLQNQMKTFCCLDKTNKEWFIMLYAFLVLKFIYNIHLLRVLHVSKSDQLKTSLEKLVCIIFYVLL